MGKKKKAVTDKPRMGRPPTGITPLRSIRISDEDYELMRKAAETEGKPISEWLRDVALRAAQRILRKPEAPP
jgi:hypothetical protein